MGKPLSGAFVQGIVEVDIRQGRFSLFIVIQCRFSQALFI